MRSALGFAAVLAVGLLALAALALTTSTTRVYTLGVNPALAAAELGPGARACQAPVRVPRDVAFDRVGFLLGTYGEPGPAVEVEVRDDASGRRLAGGRLSAGYDDLDPDRTEHVVATGRVDTDDALRLCLVNDGDRPVAVIGQAGIASPTTSATLDGEPLANDLTFSFHADETSLLARLPDIAERAARFRAGWVGPLAYLALALAIVVGAPLLLARGISLAAAEDLEH